MYQVAKRFLDIVVSFLALLVLFPISLLISILIKIDSKGSVIFISKRYGKDGIIFDMYKFRTMFIGSETFFDSEKCYLLINGLRYKSVNDPRITRVGKILRRTSLDEIPQFINVLLGQMSLVGPRPYRPDEFELFLSHNPDFTDAAKKVISIKPGITGYPQIFGRADIPFNKRIALDNIYIEKSSFVTDIKCLLNTIIVVWRQKGAY